MALVAACACEVRPGDVVFDTQARDARYPVHVGVYLGERTTTGSPATLVVHGVPAEPEGDAAGGAQWGASLTTYQPDLVGKRTDVDETEVADVALLAREMLAHQVSLREKAIQWGKKLKIDTGILVRGIPLFREGTCAHFVEYLYEGANLDLVEQRTLYDPANPDRLYPTLQMRAFLKEKFPLNGAWEPRFAEWPLSMPA